MTPALMELEMQRTMVSEQSVAMTLDAAELLNSRIPGLFIHYEESKDREGDSLSIVEDYVRSLGQPPSSKTKSGMGFGDSFGEDLFGGRSASAKAGSKATQQLAKQLGRGKPSIRITPPVFEAPSEWVQFSTALDDTYSESTWFRLSLNLLAEICKDRNAYTQRIVGSILPAECLLSVLEVSSLCTQRTAHFNGFPSQRALL